MRVFSRVARFNRRSRNRHFGILLAAIAASIVLGCTRSYAATAVRSARLVGRPHAGGAVLGRAGIVPTSTALSAAPGAAQIDFTTRGSVAPAELDRALARLRDDGSLRARLSDNARAAAGAHDWSVVGPQLAASLGLSDGNLDRGHAAAQAMDVTRL